MIERLPLVSGSKDSEFLQSTLRDFAEKTGSEVARRIINDFETHRQNFVKVFPYEYQRALKEQEEEIIQSKTITNGVTNGHEANGKAHMNGSTNGHISNGSVNGHTNGSTNGHINGSESIMNGTNGHLETSGHLKGKANDHMNGGTKGHINGHAMNGNTNGHINGTLPNGNTGKNINLIIWLTSIFRSPLIQTLMAPSENMAKIFNCYCLLFNSEFQQTRKGH